MIYKEVTPHKSLIDNPQQFLGDDLRFVKKSFDNPLVKFPFDILFFLQIS